MIDHYENPRNVGSMDKNDKNVGTGLVGAPACGDVMKLQVCNFARSGKSGNSQAISTPLLRKERRKSQGICRCHILILVW